VHKCVPESTNFETITSSFVCAFSSQPLAESIELLPNPMIDIQVRALSSNKQKMLHLSPLTPARTWHMMSVSGTQLISYSTRGRIHVFLPIMNQVYLNCLGGPSRSTLILNKRQRLPYTHVGVHVVFAICLPRLLSHDLHKVDHQRHISRKGQPWNWLAQLYFRS
jgi:hypothetical protein